MQPQIQIWWFHVKEWSWSSCSREDLPESGKGVLIQFSVAPREYPSSKKGRDVSPSLVFRSLLHDCPGAKYTDLHLVSVTHGKMCSLSSGWSYEVSLLNKDDPQGKGLIWSHRFEIIAETLEEFSCLSHQMPLTGFTLSFPQDGFRDNLEEFFRYFCA